MSNARHDDTAERFVDALAAGAVLVDEGGTIRQANDRFCKPLGYERHELVGHPLGQVVVPSLSIVRGRHLNNEGVPFVNKRGEELMVYCTTTEVAANGGSPLRLVMMQDSPIRRSPGERFLHLVSTLSERLFSGEDWQHTMREELETIAETLSAARVFVYQLAVANGKDVWRKVLDLNRIRSSMNFLQEWPIEWGKEPHALLSLGTTVLNADAPAPLQQLAGGSAAAIVMSAIRVNQQTWGFIGCQGDANRTAWRGEEVEVVITLGRLLGGAIHRQRVESALRRAEQRYRSLYERSLAGVFRNTVDGKILDCNEACARIFGFSSREQLISRHANEFYFETAQREVHMEQLMKLRTLSNVESCMRRSDGRTVWVLENATLTDGGPGEGLVIEGTIIDITDRKRAEEALRDSEERYRLMAENTTDMISRHTTDGMFLYASPASRVLLGKDPEELVGHNIRELIHADDLEGYQASQRSMREHDAAYTAQYRVTGPHGASIWVETTSRVMRSHHAGDGMELISVTRDITERKRAEELIEYQAHHDSLTGLPNRALFNDRLQFALTRAKRLENLVAVMFLDLDNFKHVNDTYGHAVGDQLLRDVSSRLRSCIREEDTLARLGGDEFTLLLFEQTDPEAPIRIAKKLLSQFEAPFVIGGREFHVTTSIGVAMYPMHGLDADVLMRNADKAMYKAKQSGRNDMKVADPLE